MVAKHEIGVWSSISVILAADSVADHVVLAVNNSLKSVHGKLLEVVSVLVLWILRITLPLEGAIRREVTVRPWLEEINLHDQKQVSMWPPLKKGIQISISTIAALTARA